LNRAQKCVIEDVLSSPDRVQGLQGWAGAGKIPAFSLPATYSMRAGWRLRTTGTMLPRSNACSNGSRSTP
jgi:hypothetical protein